jgi:hypothetical protein
MNKIIFSDGTEVPVIEPLEFTPEERVRDIKKCLRPTKEATIETNIYFTPLYVMEDPQWNYNHK